MKTMTPARFREYRQSARESDYLLIDVRQPGEYDQAHIPGALLIPLGELEEKIDDLPDKDLIFYCRSGARSRAAALNARHFAGPDTRIFNLDGGILAWDGTRLSGFPDLAPVSLESGSEAALTAAMNLEKGAHRFYSHVLDSFPDRDLQALLVRVRDGELAHARLIHGHLQRVNPGAPDFDTLYDSLEGDILEGGKPLGAYLEALGQEAGRLDILEASIAMEYQAYDLYRTIADTRDDTGLSEAFLALSQAEKHHMELLIGALEGTARN